MSDKHQKPGQSISPELLRKISSQVINAHPEQATVSGQDLADLKAVLSGKIKVHGAVDRKRGINLLARSEQSDDVGAILGAILSNVHESASDRAAAALQMGTIPLADVEKRLLDQLATDDAVLRSEIIRALGHIGATASLAALDRLPQSESDAVTREIDLARLLILLRTDPDGGAVTAGKMLGVAWRHEQVRPVLGEQARMLVAEFAGDRWGLRLSSELVLVFECGALEYGLFLNDELAPDTLRARITSRSMLAGIVGVRERRTPYFSTRFLVFTCPLDSGIEIVVSATHGGAVYAGSGRPNGAALHFMLRDVGSTLSPTEIEGQVEKDGTLRFGLRRWAGTPKKKKTGHPGDVDSNANQIKPR